MRALFLALLLIGLVCGSASAADWEELKGCRLVADEYGDGDSFHVRQGDRDYIFRLYFVDCPETDARFPDRVAEQAKYFGISSKAALALGEKAKAFTFAVLAKPFIVWTKWQDARGSSKQHRFYAIVVPDREPDMTLDALLVRNGLARIHGVSTTTPKGDSGEAVKTVLQTLEDNARVAKRGGWAGDTLKTTPDDPLDDVIVTEVPL
jgi:endonuclease YncB( thermonuclease family)